MKSVFLVGRERLKLEDVPDPIAPDDGLVLKVKTCGICGSDLRRWKEGPEQGVDGIVPGHEVAGLVVEVGKNLTDYCPGDRLAIAPDVLCLGADASHKFYDTQVISLLPLRRAHRTQSYSFLIS